MNVSKTQMPAPASSSRLYDVAIIGAGVIGCAIARSAAIRGLRTVVVEKAADILEGASKGNSALLHTGFDEPAGSHELRLVKNGYAIYRRIHTRMNLPFERTGALVVAWDEEQRDRLVGIAAHATTVGVTATIIDRDALREHEPQLSNQALGAVLVPEEGIIDPWSAPLAYLQQALLHGASLLTGAEVTRIDEIAEGWQLNTPRGPLAARLVVNAAGLFGDHIDRLAGRASRFTIRPRKGQFVVFDKPARELVNAIILKVPTERTKGVLLSRTVFGNLLLGPTAEDQDDRIHARTDEAVLRRIIAEGEAMLPALASQEVTATFAGLRPATEHRDYQLAVDGATRFITIGGVRSTGLSASLGIGEWAATEAATLLGVNPQAPPDDELDWPQMPNLAEARPRPYQSPGHSAIVCHCEWVTEGEVAGALAGAVPAGTLGGLRRRTRAMMGRCQGFGCADAVARLAPNLCGMPLAEAAE
jgi:glycerol-3-phosphate dehydrogenase